MSDSGEEPCGNCDAEGVHVEHCYGCGYDYCEDCGFMGGCGVCVREAHAWAQYEKARITIQEMKPKGKRTKTHLEQLIRFMEYWQEAVQNGEEEIRCMSFYGEKGVHDASEIMIDCGDAVIHEMSWFLEKAKEICKGTATFDW